MPSPSEASTSRSSSPASDAGSKHSDVLEAEVDTSSAPAPTSFESLGIIPPLLEALEQMKFTKPTEIQVQAIPYGLQGRDIIGVAETVCS